MDLEAWRERSDRLCDHLQQWSGFAKAQTVLAYFSFRQEPDLSPLFNLKENPKYWGFPRCEGKALFWHHWSPSHPLPLLTGPYGIVEPDPSAPAIHVDSVDLVLVPTVACDERGYRLGYGGGFYDRMLSAPEWQAKLTIGIVFEDARVPQLPIDSWDQPLAGVCTEAGVFLV